MLICQTDTYKYALYAQKTADILKYAYDLSQQKEIQAESLLKKLLIDASDSDVLKEMKAKTTHFVLSALKEDRHEEIIEKIAELAIHVYNENPELDFSDYDIYVFDADKTIWEGVPACQMEEPYQRKGDVIIDKNGNQIRLKEGVFEVFYLLNSLEKEIGIISKSELEGVDTQDQPVVKLLKILELMDYVDHLSISKLPKSIFMPEGDRVVFIDDDIKNISDVFMNAGVDSVLADNEIFEDIKEDMHQKKYNPVKKISFGKDWYKFAQVEDVHETISKQIEKQREKKQKEEENLEQTRETGLSNLNF